jgi:hypothetical protein
MRDNGFSWTTRKSAVLSCNVYIVCQTTRNDGFIKWDEDIFFLITQEAKKKSENWGSWYWQWATLIAGWEHHWPRSEHS